MSLLECTGLVRNWGALRAVDAIDLSIDAGEFVALIGPNGAGKTTVFNLIAGTLRKTAGKVWLNGEDISVLPSHAVARRGVARTFQISALFSNLTAVENVRLASQSCERHRVWPWPRRDLLEHTRAEALHWLDRVGIGGHANTRAIFLSHGDQRLLEIAMALAQRPRLLLLDEPTQGMSVEESKCTMLLLAELFKDGSTGILLVEHDLEVVFGLAHRIVVMHHGRKIADGTASSVRNNVEVQNAYLGHTV
jgi:branched-chain amino acid transport system ATP-binding protein